MMVVVGAYVVGVCYYFHSDTPFVYAAPRKGGQGVRLGNNCRRGLPVKLGHGGGELLALLILMHAN